jgi:hypothetical protein
MTSAIVAGALANKPWNGGNAWTRLSFLLGLRQLGLEVYFVEQVKRATEEGRLYFKLVTESFSIPGALIQTDSPIPVEALEAAESAELLVNIGGHLTFELLKRPPRHKVFLDDDPAYTQFWHAAGQLGDRLAGHDAYFTYGTNIGGPGCPIPTSGIDWCAILPPVVLSEWPAAHGRLDRFTTVASWRGAYDPVEHDGRVYGLKAHEFRKVADLPERVARTFEIALDIHEADARDRDLLEGHGWQLVDPRIAAGTPKAFRDYVQGSGAEFSVAQGIYVETQSGWFSDRTVSYLASGKPALVQDTGFSLTIPVGDGLLAFRTLEEAAVGAERLGAEYEAHAAAARAIAEEYFDSQVILTRLLDIAGVGS